MANCEVDQDPGLESRSFVIDKERVQSLDTNTVNMTAVMCTTEKFVRKVCKPNEDRFPPLSPCSVGCFLQRHLQDGKNSSAASSLPGKNMKEGKNSLQLVTVFQSSSYLSIR